MTSRLLFVFLILSLMMNVDCKDYPKPPSSIKSDEGMSGTGSSPASTFSSPSSSSRISSISGSVPLIISKHTKDLKTEYEKNDNITFVIRIINCDLQNDVESAQLRDEIPDGFRVIDPVINNASNPKIISRDGIQMLLWNFPDRLANIKYINYTLQGNKTGPHNFVGALLTATVSDHNAIVHKITSVSEDLNIIMKNNPPELISHNISNPTYVKLNSRLFINASFKDEDNDPIECKLVFDNDTSIKIWPQDNKTDVLTWDISKYTNEDREFVLVADDGDSEVSYGPFSIKTYHLTDLERYIFSEEMLNFTSFLFENFLRLIVALGSIAVVIITILFTIHKRNKAMDKLGSMISPKRRKEQRNYTKLQDAIEHNKKGLSFLKYHKLDDAIREFDMALKIDPDLPAVHNNIGKAHYAKRSYEEALKHFNKAIELDNNFAEAHHNKAETLIKLNRNLDDAKKSEDLAVELGYKK